MTLATLDSAPAASPDAPTPKKLLLYPPQGSTPSPDPLDTPTLTLFQPPARLATGAALVLCPGGSYSHHTPADCDPLATWLTTLGITALLLRYRLGPRHTHPAPLQDAARAVKMARALAAPWKLDPNRVGLLGLAAGAHLAATLSTHFTDGNRAAPDPIDRFSSRPDLALLIHPLISLTHTHTPSLPNLLGPSPTPEQLHHLSADKHVTKRTPPTFLFHTLDDPTIPADNTLLYFHALRASNVPAELHLSEPTPDTPADTIPFPTWSSLAARWLSTRRFANGT